MVRQRELWAISSERIVGIAILAVIRVFSATRLL
jgi:hypothetical protein